MPRMAVVTEACYGQEVLPIMNRVVRHDHIDYRGSQVVTTRTSCL